MAHRPILQKRVRRMRKALRQTPPTFIDLIQWLKLHGHAQTTGEAKRLILAKRVKSESHVLGIEKQPQIVGNKVEEIDVVNPYVPAHVRPTLRVVSA